jgi:hypothetical protein
MTVEEASGTTAETVPSDNTAIACGVTGVAVP